jgi:hypothetical protein
MRAMTARSGVSGGQVIGLLRMTAESGLAMLCCMALSRGSLMRAD